MKRSSYPPLIDGCHLCRYSTKTVNVKFAGEKYYTAYAVCAMHLKKVQALGEEDPDRTDPPKAA